MKAALIAAVADNGVIGVSGALPWRIAADMRWFKAHTMGKPVVMGRKTWDSLPKKPLPGRANIVVTRAKDFAAAGAVVAHDILGALELARAEAARSGAGEIMVIGGAEIYAVALPFVDRLYLTRVHATPQGDALFPNFDSRTWREVFREPHPASENAGTGFTFLILDRQG